MISPAKKGLIWCVLYYLRTVCLIVFPRTTIIFSFLAPLFLSSFLPSTLCFVPLFSICLRHFSDTYVRIGIQIASPLVNMLYWPSVDSSSARLFGTIMFTTGLTIAWAWELGEADGASGIVTCVLSSNLFSERISSEMGFFNNHLFF